MKKLEFSTEIDASALKVWSTLTGAAEYTEWSGGNTIKGDWSEGSEMVFLDPQNNGMYNLVESNKTAQELKMKHLGWIMDGEKNPQNWENSDISYVLEPQGQATVLRAVVNSLDEFEDFYKGFIPKIFSKIKEISER